MTAQIQERLRYQGEYLGMSSTPLNDFFELRGHTPAFQYDCTALWRGYIGSWDITDDRLYLVALQGTFADGSPVSLERVFPGYPERVFAHWFSGSVRIPQGELLDYVHMGFGSTHERDLILCFEQGLLVRTVVHHNDLDHVAERLMAKHLAGGAA